MRRRHQIPEPHAMTLATNAHRTDDRRPGSYCSAGSTTADSRFSPTTRVAKRRTGARIPGRHLFSFGTTWNARCASKARSSGSATRSQIGTFMPVRRARASAPGPRRRARLSRAARNSRNDAVTWRIGLPTTHPPASALGGYRLVPETIEFWQRPPEPPTRPPPLHPAPPG